MNYAQDAFTTYASVILETTDYQASARDSMSGIVIVVVSTMSSIVVAALLGSLLFIVWRRSRRIDRWAEFVCTIYGFSIYFAFAWFRSSHYLATVPTAEHTFEDIGEGKSILELKTNSIDNQSPRETSTDFFSLSLTETCHDTSTHTILPGQCSLSGQAVKTDDTLNCSPAGENGVCLGHETTQDVPLRCVSPELCNEVELVVPKLEEVPHVGALHRPAPSIPGSDVQTPDAQTQSLPGKFDEQVSTSTGNLQVPGGVVADDKYNNDENGRADITPKNGTDSSVQGAHPCIQLEEFSVENSARAVTGPTGLRTVKVYTEQGHLRDTQSHVLVLHHDDEGDATDGLRITEGLVRNGIRCLSHHMDYLQILEMGEKGWLASSLRHCTCVLLLCTQSFRDATEGTNSSHFVVSQRLIEEAVRRLSSGHDGDHEDDVYREIPSIFPIVRKANDKRFIPKCMRDLDWFQIPSENQWVKLVWTIRARLPGYDENVEV